MDNNVLKTLKDLFESNGVYINEENFDEVLELDSLAFITLIVEIENTFNVNFQSNESIFLDISSGAITFNKIKDSLLSLINSGN